MGRRVSVVTNPSMRDRAGHMGKMDPRDFLMGARWWGGGVGRDSSEAAGSVLWVRSKGKAATPELSTLSILGPHLRTHRLICLKSIFLHQLSVNRKLVTCSGKWHCFVTVL